MSDDAAPTRYVRHGVDHGGERNAASSSGWRANTWVWENDFVTIVITGHAANNRSFAVDVKQDSGVKRVAMASCWRGY